jgi:RNA polymerase sigma-70 factor (ECF subfamily)
MENETTTEPEAWVDEHGDYLYRLALSRLGDPDLAADMVQEALLEGLRSRSSFSGRSSLRTWLAAILKHKIIDHRRKEGRERPAGDFRGHLGPPEPMFDQRGRWRVGPARWSTEPSRSLEQAEFWDVIDRCLSKLPRRLADVFIQRVLHERNGEDVRMDESISPANFWARMHRARLLLRRCIEENWFAPSARRR